MITGFRIYAPIIDRLGDCRQLGPQSISFRCPFTDRHKNGDRRTRRFAFRDDPLPWAAATGSGVRQAGGSRVGQGGIGGRRRGRGLFKT